MALIKKEIICCNRCKCEVDDGKPNVQLLGEEYFLCDDCAIIALNWLEAEGNLSEKQETETTPSDSRVYVPAPYPQRSATYHQWDDEEIRSLIEHYNKGMKMKSLACMLGVTVPSVSSLLNKIRHCENYDNYAQYKRLLTKRR